MYVYLLRPVAAGGFARENSMVPRFPGSRRHLSSRAASLEPTPFPRPPFPSISLPHSSPPPPLSPRGTRRPPRGSETSNPSRNHASAGTNGRREIRTGPRARLKYFNGVSMRRDPSARYGAFRYVCFFIVIS